MSARTLAMSAGAVVNQGRDRWRRRARVAQPVRRLVVGLAALAAGGAAFGLSWASAVTEWRRTAVVIGAAGLVLLAGALGWRPRWLPAAIVVLGAGFALCLPGQSEPAAVTVPVAALLMAAMELAGWAQDLRTRVPASAAVTRARARSVVLRTAFAALAAAGVLAVAGLPAPGGILPELAGVGATVGVVALVALRRWREELPPSGE
jgi:hypothetical protein